MNDIIDEESLESAITKVVKIARVAGTKSSGKSNNDVLQKILHELTNGK
jgi:hypothetical protein